MLAMLATAMLAGAAFAAVGGDIPFARAAQDRKQAYAAAEAGIDYYLYQLSRDNDYWTHCDNVPDTEDGQPAPVNRVDPTPSARKWRNLPESDARFSIEVLPANDELACDPNQAEQTMLDAGTGSFRIRSTGESRGVRRSVVSMFRRSSFLDYLYFTDFETSDPLTYLSSTDQARAAEECVKYRADRNSWCRDTGDITFPTFDAINGPLHTNDDLLICGSPSFGRENPPSGVDKDKIEISGPATDGWTAGDSGSCGGQGTADPTFWGIKRHPAPGLAVPTSNNRLRDATLPGYLFTGQTTIRFNSLTTMRVTTYPVGSSNPTTYDTPLPPNGVIYVEKDPSRSCTIDPPRQLNYDADRGCAILTVSGQYPTSMTLGSQDDILVDDNLTRRDSGVVLGLIAQRFVRVKHDVSGDCDDNISYPGTIFNITIQAAILTLDHSFIVDNYRCGNPLGTLRVDGAIAQKFRGPVGTFSGSGKSSGYTKDYWYDDRLKYRSPPFFLDPISAAWNVVRSNEQVPAAK